MSRLSLKNQPAPARKEASAPSPPSPPAEKPAAGTPEPAAVQPSGGSGQRLMSVDALRGFDMFWIVGAASIAHALDRMGDAAIFQVLSNQLRHPRWEGFTFFDLIFPMFIFIVGVSLVFSLTRTLANDGRDAALSRVFRRSVLLFVIGIFYAGGFSNSVEDIRWMGVLQRIALCYFFAALLFCYFTPKTLGGICASLLVGYWALLTFVPVPGIGAASYDEGKNLANYLDNLLLPGRLYRETWDPEGILSTLPAIATCLLGVFAGLLLKDGAWSPRASGATAAGRPERVGLILLGAGAGCLVAGYLWSLQFPLNKHIWTSSFVLVTGGYSAILLGIFHLTIDVWGFRKWCVPFVWIGMNPITIYLAHNLVNFRGIANRIAGGDIREFLNTNVAQGSGDFLVALVVLGLSFLVCWFLYRKRIFLRL